MVFVNDKKYACESCIKGHRSSSCGHSDRPLFEIKKKGRPVSQCEKCRDLRKTKRVHSKCGCTSDKSERTELKPLSGKSKRYIPILPALPNGLKDTSRTQSNTESNAVDPKAKVDDLLNPCTCKDVWSCQCRASRYGGGLEALAKAAALCCAANDGAVPRSQCSSSIPPLEEASSSCCKDPVINPPLSKHRKRRSSTTSLERDRSKRGPSLPPILLPPTLPYDTPPVYPTIPSLSTVASLAGTGCTCGFNCTCPGCVEHRGTVHASEDHQDCPDECGTCVDHQHGIELPTPTGYGSASVGPSVSGISFIDAFFARAAAKIPPPPSLRASASAALFDPMNVTVYPQSLFSGEGKRLDEHGPAFGLVKLPKLECCAGKCGCAGDTCGCGQECNGCCSIHENEGHKGIGRSPIEESNDIIAENLSRGDCCSVGV